MVNALLDVNAVARLLSISPFTVRLYVRQSKLVPIRIGRRVLFEMEAVESFVNEAKRQGTSSTGPALSGTPLA